MPVTFTSLPVIWRAVLLNVAPSPLIEIVFPMDVVSKMDTEELFMDAFYVSNMFRFVSRGSNLVIVLDIIKLDKHPVYYLVELLNKIYDKFGKNID